LKNGSAGLSDSAAHQDHDAFALSSASSAPLPTSHLTLANRINMLKLVAASATVATVLGAPTVPKTTERFNEVRSRFQPLS